MKRIRSLKEVMDAKPKHRKLKKNSYKKKKHKPIKFKSVKKVTKKATKKKVNKTPIIINREDYINLYYEYLKTDTWKIKRDKVLKRADNKCEICKVKKATQVHHKTYTGVYLVSRTRIAGKEKLKDLIATCGVCHRAEHNLLTEEEIEIAVLELIKKERNYEI